jgi:hypothetical protein
MKGEDPTILVGGPATESIKVEYISEVVKHSMPHIDFVSGHTYGGDGKQPDSVSYASAKKTVADFRVLRTRLTAIARNKYIPIFMDEYNIGWDHTPRIYNNEGAVYFSLIQVGTVDAGGDISAVWDYSPAHDMSIVGSDCKLHVSANLFTLMNKYFYGKEVSASSGQASIYAYAVKGVSTHSVLLSNLSASRKTVSLVFQGWAPTQVNESQISITGYQAPKKVDWPLIQRSGIILPARSVTILVSQ